MCINCISLLIAFFYYLFYQNENFMQNLVGGVPEARVKEKECHTEEAKKKVLIANFYRWNNKLRRIVVSNWLLLIC